MSHSDIEEANIKKYGTPPSIDQKARDTETFLRLATTEPIMLRGLAPDDLRSTSGSIRSAILFYSGKSILFSCHPRFMYTPLHKHTYIEMQYLYNGRISQTVNGKMVEMEKGSLCILNTSSCHSIEYAGEEDILINAIIGTDYLENVLLGRLGGSDPTKSFLFRSIYQPKDNTDFLLVGQSEAPRIEGYMVDLLCEYFDRSLCSEEVINSYLVLVFTELMRSFANRQNGGEQFGLKLEINAIIEYIQNNCATADLPSVAKHFGLSQNYLSAKLKRMTGLGFISLLHRAKLEKACLLLSCTDLPVGDVVCEVGYENTSFFYKKFKQSYGLTPNQFKQNKHRFPSLVDWDPHERHYRPEGIESGEKNS